MTLVAEEQATTKAKPFPVFALVGAVCRFVYDHVFDFIKIAWLPLLILVILNSEVLRSYLFHTFVMTGDTPAERPTIGVGTLKHIQTFVILGFIQFVFIAMVQVAFLRYVLLSERRFGWAQTGLAFGPIERRYFWWLNAFGLFAAVIAVVSVSIISPVLFALTYDSQRVSFDLIDRLQPLASYLTTALLALIAPLYFRFPAVAVGDRSGFAHLWQKAEGNRLRIAALFIIIPIGSSLAVSALFAFLSFLTGLIPASLDFHSAAAVAGTKVAFGVLNASIFALRGMLEATMMALAYREIIGLPTAPEAGTESA